jgi:hypothetical protein
VRLKREAAGDTLAQAAVRASEAGRRLADLAAAIQDKAQASAHATRRHSAEYAGRVGQGVVNHPLVSIGIAMLVGAALWAVLTRR